MNWRERVSVSIPCYGITFSAVLYITNAPLYSVVYQFYDMRFFVCETSSPPPVLHNFLLVHNLLPQSTLIFWRKLCNTGGGGQHRIRKNWNPYIFFQINALMDIKISIIDICYANTALNPKTLMFSLLHEWKI